MPIRMPEKKESGLGTLVGAAGKIAGLASGNPVDTAGALMPDSPLGRAAGLVKTGEKLFGAETPATPTEAPGTTDPLARRAESDPHFLIHQGLELADDPSLPLDYETRMAVIEPLLRAKHFGRGGGLA